MADNDDDEFETHLFPIARTLCPKRQTIQEYQEAIITNCEELVRVIPAQGDWFVEQRLTCFILPPSAAPIPKFSHTGNGWQYSLYEGRVRVRRKAYRVPFLLHPQYLNDRFGVSHLCHNNECMNWDHHVLELLAVNKARNGCPAGAHCHHRVRCLIPGPYFNA